mgnify:CR=1 FL=1
MKLADRIREWDFVKIILVIVIFVGFDIAMSQFAYKMAITIQYGQTRFDFRIPENYFFNMNLYRLVIGAKSIFIVAIAMITGHEILK